MRSFWQAQVAVLVAMSITPLVKYCIVEQLDDKTLPVEFSDDQGRAYAVAPCPREDLLVLHYVPEAV
jgi:hypothetical protein